MKVSKRVGTLALTIVVQALLLGAAGAYAVARSQVSEVEAFDTDSWTVFGHADERIRVEVRGDGDTDLDLYVYDENGNLIASDTDELDHCIASWTPRWSGVFHVEVKNLGSVYNRYVLSIQ